MTAVENLRRLEIVFPLPDEKTRRANIMNIRPTEADSDLYDITIAIANLINDPLASKSFRNHKRRRIWSFKTKGMHYKRRGNANNVQVIQANTKVKKGGAKKLRHKMNICPYGFGYVIVIVLVVPFH